MNSNESTIDWYILVPVIILSLSGLVTLLDFGYSNWFLNNTQFLRQLLYLGLGALAVHIISKRDVKFLSHSGFISVLYGVSLVVLIAVLFLGKQINGARSWFDLGIVSLQPADFVKIVFIIVLAKYLSKRHVALAHIKHFIITGIYFVLPVGLILLQPDFGTAMVFGAIWITLLLVAGLSRKFTIGLFVIGAVVATTAWFTLLQDYQKERIQTFVSPLSDITGSGYNAYQSVVAVGSGGVVGKGLGFGTQSRLEYLPEHHTDFIFASFSEEWGYVGAVIVVIAVMVLLVRLFVHAKRSRSNFESLFIIGYAVLIGTHSIIHIGMNIGVLPVTGLPLPFASFGGSHILVESIGLGIVLAMIRKYSTTTSRHSYVKEFTSLTETL
jgi:rod shape determining protein RodA